jgi:hypothetical protein
MPTITSRKGPVGCSSYKSTSCFAKAQAFVKLGISRRGQEALAGETAASLRHLLLRQWVHRGLANRSFCTTSVSGMLTIPYLLPLLSYRPTGVSRGSWSLGASLRTELSRSTWRWRHSWTGSSGRGWKRPRALHLKRNLHAFPTVGAFFSLD